MEGLGILTAPKESYTYHGEFKKGGVHGKMTYYSKDGKEVFNMQWEYVLKEDGTTKSKKVLETDISNNKEAAWYKNGKPYKVLKN